MKYEWRKKDKALYLPGTKPVVITVPSMQYITVNGTGHPDSDMFSNCIEALYAISYGIKMSLKSGQAPEGYFDYTVFPLEGLWNLDEVGIEKYNEGTPVIELKDHLIYKLMVRQPDFVQADFVEEVRQKVMNKKNNNKLDALKFEEFDEGKSVQVMHLGSYDLEPITVDIMEKFTLEQGLVRKGKKHKEIYVTDARRVTTDKLKTTLRFWVEER